MTWHAPYGRLVLKGEEREIFKESILELCQLILDLGDEFESGEHVFDALTDTQKLASLEVVAKYLFTETEEPLALTAWSEVTLAVILGNIRTNLLIEAEDPEADCGIRPVIKEHAGVDADDLAGSKWDDPDTWDSIFDGYESRFLWDDDFSDATIADLSPEASSVVKNTMGISNDYYSSIPPDFEHESETRNIEKRIQIAADGKRTIRMVATLTTEVPASLEIQERDGLKMILGCFPTITLMTDHGDGAASTASDELLQYLEDGSVVDYDIDYVDDTDVAS